MFDSTLVCVMCVHAQSCLTLCNPMDCSLPGSSVHGDSPGKNTGVGCHALLQGIFPTQGSNPGLPHCRQILYQLSRKGSPRILEWVAYPFSSRSSQPRTQTRVERRFSSVQFSRSVVSDSLRPHESQHTRPPCPSPFPGVHSDSRPSGP